MSLAKSQELVNIGNYEKCPRLPQFLAAILLHVVRGLLRPWNEVAHRGIIANAAIIRGHGGVDEVVVEVVQGVVGGEHGVEELRQLRSLKDAPEVAAGVAPFLGAFPKLGSLL